MVLAKKECLTEIEKKKLSSLQSATRGPATLVESLFLFNKICNLHVRVWFEVVGHLLVETFCRNFVHGKIKYWSKS